MYMHCDVNIYNYIAIYVHKIANTCAMDKNMLISFQFLYYSI